MNNNSRPLVSILLPSHNRCNEVLLAVETAFEQDYDKLEVLVYDDCSEDGTVEAIRSKFPAAKVFAHTSKQSATALRNEGFREAKGEYIISLDDDSYFSERTIVSDIVKYFINRPNLAVVGIPYVEPYNSSSYLPKLLNEGESIAAYTGCAAAFRKSAIIAVDGYRKCYKYYGLEEGDMAIRLRDRGFELIQGKSGYIVHTKSPKGTIRTQSRFGARNGLFFIWLNLPLEYDIRYVSLGLFEVQV